MMPGSHSINGQNFAKLWGFSSCKGENPDKKKKLSREEVVLLHADKVLKGFDTNATGHSNLIKEMH